MPQHLHKGRDRIESTLTMLSKLQILCYLRKALLKAVCGKKGKVLKTSSQIPYLQILLRWSNTLIWDMGVSAT